MHTNLGSDIEGITNAAIDFLAARARGGFGLIGVGVINSYMVPGDESPLEYFLNNHRHIANYARCVSEITQYDAVPYAQIGVRTPFGKVSRKNPPSLSRLSVDQIEEMIQSIVDCAVRAAAAGFPAVDILGVGGSAHSLFLSPVFNDRTDEWGGTAEARRLFALKTIAGIKKALGSSYPIFYRLHGSEFIKGGYSVEGAVENAVAFAQAGVCYFNVAGGGNSTEVPQLTPNVLHAAYSFLASEVKKAVNVPVAASVRNTRPFEAEAILRDGWADMISLGRQSLADADWPNKIAKGAYEDLRLCIGCNECLDVAAVQHKPVQCLVNPRLGEVSEVQFLPHASVVKKVAVIGGGVTGLQAALSCAERGHQVVLFERKSHLGGMWHQASQPVGREELLNFLKWLVHSVQVAGVDIRTGTEATESVLAADRPDVIIVSAGSDMVAPDIPGMESPHVMPATEALIGDVVMGQYCSF